ncbi:hypothetical protein KKH43_02235 [Patescibacteria group bacterium]|nr:hypothetical protein [Patescibacteria group bacterium]
MKRQLKTTIQFFSMICVLALFCVSCASIEKKYCQNSDECPDGKICLNGNCVGCSSDTDCGDGKVCENGSCVAKCTKDGDCGEGKICINGHCTDSTRCIDNNCANGQVCKDGLCKDCADNGDCKEGEICKDGQCTKSGCTDDRDCPKDHKCVNGTCVPPTTQPACKDDRDCPTNYHCDKGVCVPDPCACNNSSDCVGDNKGYVCETCSCRPCKDDTECPTGFVCKSGRCEPKSTPQCKTYTDCPIENICKEGTCVPGCPDDNWCKGTRICIEGQCVDGCRKDTDCKQGQICVNNKCVDPPPECVEDKDCPSPNKCVGGKCIGPGTKDYCFVELKYEKVNGELVRKMYISGHYWPTDKATELSIRGLCYVNLTCRSACALSPPHRASLAAGTSPSWWVQINDKTKDGQILYNQKCWYVEHYDLSGCVPGAGVRIHNKVSADNPGSFWVCDSRYNPDPAAQKACFPKSTP